MEALIPVTVGLVLGTWLYSAFNWIQAIRHRKPEISLGTMLTKGSTAFDSGNFTAKGVVYQRRFARGAVAFFVCIALGVAVGVFLASQANAQP